jgi:hypothetical protein
VDALDACAALLVEETPFQDTVLDTAFRGIERDSSCAATFLFQKRHDERRRAKPTNLRQKTYQLESYVVVS